MSCARVAHANVPGAGNLPAAEYGPSAVLCCLAGKPSFRRHSDSYGSVQMESSRYGPLPAGYYSTR